MDLDMKGEEVQATAIVACWVAICALGIISNVIQTLMMTSKSEKDTSYGIYLTALALTDSLILLIKVSEGAVFLVVLDTEVPFARSTWKVWTSAIVTAIKAAAQSISAWILVVIAVDRIIVLCFPPQRLVLCSRHRALWVTAVIIIASLLLHVPFLGVYLHRTQQMNTTVALAREHFAIVVTNQLPFGLCDALALWVPYAVIFQALSAYLIPTVLLFPFCIILILALISRYQKLYLIWMTDRLTAERIKKQNQLTITMLVILFKYLLFAVPYGITLLLFYLLPSGVSVLTGVTGVIPQTVSSVAPRWLVLCSLEILVLLGRASHVWVLLGDSYFRRILYQVMCVERTRMNASLTTVTMRRQEIERTLDDESGSVDKKVIGLRVSSNLSSFRRDLGSTETATPETIRTYEVDMDPTHIPDIRPTEIVLKETAKRLSIIVENSKL